VPELEEEANGCVPLDDEDSCHVLTLV